MCLETFYQTGCQFRLAPPHPHVLLSLQPVLCRHLPHIHYPQRCCGTSRHRAKLSPMKAESPRCIFNTLCRVGWLSHDCDGLWLLCGHLPPLHYTVIMNPQICRILVLVSWAITVFHSLLQTLMELRLFFCRTGNPSLFLWTPPDGPTCLFGQPSSWHGDFTAGMLADGPLSGIFNSYSKIVSPICGILSAQGKLKASSTCISPLCGLLILLYMLRRVS